MSFTDLISVFQWWVTIFVIGIIFLPLITRIFSNFFDKGYIFAKIIGTVFISYVVFILGFLKILPFETQNVFLIAGVFLLINLFIKKKSPLPNIRSLLPIFILEECMFLAILMLWSFIHAHAPDIHGLEKYMDYGFINSILRTKYFPPLDMWFTPYPINYYYFGHLTTAILTKLSFLSSAITFNLMLSTIAAISFTAAFSIAANLLYSLCRKTNLKIPMIGGLITAFLLNFAGNLHTIYLFFKPYENENPVPFWDLAFSPQTYPNSYWYPNATRFIENTIHEFPIYSNVVSDLHGHFLDIPLVLLTIAALLSLFFKSKLEIGNWKLEIALISFLLAVTYMTNAWDGIIYFLLTALIFLYIILKSQNNSDFTGINNLKLKIKNWITHLAILSSGFIIFTMPFNLNFKPFASNIGILCAPKFLTDISKFGPFLFEVNHCQHSPLWQFGTLYGFFYFWVISFVIFIFKKSKLSHLNFIKNLKLKIENLPSSDIFVLILIMLSTMLIVIPEFIYVKDIYPAHYRANTMFKLAYQAFIVLSLCSGYIIIRLALSYKKKLLTACYALFSIILIILVSLYPYFAINSYFGDLKVYSGINGTSYIKSLYPSDYEAIQWINKNIKGQPVILEASGDSYTDYARVSANTGLPTVLGWTVHEWLWRGTYDIPAPRIAEIEKMYESSDLEGTKNLLQKHNVSLIFIGDLERQKYSDLNEEKFKSLGKVAYQKGDTKIFRIDIK